MWEPVEWLPDGTPRSPRFDGRYRTSTGGLDRARHVFLNGCGLPGAWAGQSQWRILETGFGLGMNFLAAWRAWKDDPSRPALLHFVSIEAWPVSAADLLRSAAHHEELVALAKELGAQWFGLLPGVHRLAFEQGRVLLTLFIGDVRDGLRQHRFNADSIFLDGFDPLRNAAMWDLQVIKAVARHCRRGTQVATWTVAGDVRRDLAQCGFAIEKAQGLPPKRQCLKGVFAPAWEPKGQLPANATAPSDCIVIGSGLAGAAAAASLARRGWRVTVLDRADRPAAGASGLPVGLLAANDSPDDNLLSRLSRSGVRLALQQARELLREGEDWRATGVLERRFAQPQSGPPIRAGAHNDWTRPAEHEHRAAARLNCDASAVWHEQAGWIKPAALVSAWLAQPGVAWRGNTEVRAIDRHQQGWIATDTQGQQCAMGQLVVVAAAYASAALLPGGVVLQPVRGQVSWAEQEIQAELPAFPVNGNGHFIPNVPLGGETERKAWYCGSTFDRDDVDLAPRQADHQYNLARLQALLPAAAQELAAAFTNGKIRAWTGVRCASQDRRPLVGEIEPGLWVSTAMGSRGLTFAVLCAELLAAQLHGEPLPLERRLALALGTARQRGDPTLAH